jgi:hypothetical protein
LTHINVWWDWEPKLNHIIMVGLGEKVDKYNSMVELGDVVDS